MLDLVTNGAQEEVAHLLASPSNYRADFLAIW